MKFSVNVLHETTPDALLSAATEYAGRNALERLMLMARTVVQGADTWSHETLHAYCCELQRRLSFAQRRTLMESAGPNSAGPWPNDATRALPAPIPTAVQVSPPPIPAPPARSWPGAPDPTYPKSPNAIDITSVVASAPPQLTYEMVRGGPSERLAKAINFLRGDEGYAALSWEQQVSVASAKLKSGELVCQVYGAGR